MASLRIFLQRRLSGASFLLMNSADFLWKFRIGVLLFGRSLKPVSRCRMRVLEGRSSFVSPFTEPRGRSTQLVKRTCRKRTSRLLHPDLRAGADPQSRRSPVGFMFQKWVTEIAVIMSRDQSPADGLEPCDPTEKPQTHFAIQSEELASCPLIHQCLNLGPQESIVTCRELVT